MEATFEEHVVERAVLVGLNADCFTKEQTATDETIEELEALLETAGGFCTGKILQNRHTPDAHCFIGEGKALDIVVLGCKNLEKDGELLSKIAEALQGKNVLCMSAKQENCKTVGASVVLAYGQKVGAETADDINLAKQLNIMLKKDANVASESIVMDIGTAAVGYGYEYAASTFDRIRLAALAQSDADLQMPILATVALDTWGVKESTASAEDEPAWGCQEERAIGMEVATAAADLTGGADAVVLRHPASVATIKKFITELI